MTDKTTPIVRDFGMLALIGVPGLALAVWGGWALAHGSKLGGAVALFFGAMFLFAAATAHKASCPACGAEVKVARLSALTGEADKYNACEACWTYFEGKDALTAMAPDSVAPSPAFRAPLPYEDLRYATAGASIGQIVAPGAQERVVEAKWPARCAACGRASTKSERVAQTVVVQGQGMGGVVSKRVTLVAQVPHCAEHSGGAAFAQSQGGWTLASQSYAFQTELRRLNGWPKPPAA